MASTLDRIAAAEMVRQALAGGVDVRTLNDDDYRLVRDAVLRQAGGGRPPPDGTAADHVRNMDHHNYQRAKSALLGQFGADQMRARDARDLAAAARRHDPTKES